MSCPSNVVFDQDFDFSITTKSTAGVPTDADSNPTYSVYESGSVAAMTSFSGLEMTVLDDDSTTGVYKATISATSTNGFEVDQTYIIVISAVVGGVLGSKTYAFMCTQFSGPQPIVVTAPALTREEIKEQVDGYTHRLADKESQMDKLCDEALRRACTIHAFDDACSEESKWTVSGVDHVALPSSNRDIVSVRVVDTTNSREWKLSVKGRQWWDSKIVTGSYDATEKPIYGLKFAGNLYLYPIPDGVYEIRFRMLSAPRFTNDTTLCPVPLLDTFVVQYVTAFTFLSIKDRDSFADWKKEYIESLAEAINADKENTSEDVVLDELTAEDLGIGDSSFPIHTSPDSDLGSLTWL